MVRAGPRRPWRARSQHTPQTARRLRKEKAGGTWSSSESRAAWPGSRGQTLELLQRKQEQNVLPALPGVHKEQISCHPPPGQTPSQQVLHCCPGLELLHFLPSHNPRPRHKCILCLGGCSGTFQKQQRRGRAFPQRGSILVPQESGATWERREL